MYVRPKSSVRRCRHRQEEVLRVLCANHQCYCCYVVRYITESVTRERVGEEELIAHDGIILIDDARIQVGKEERNNFTFSSLEASSSNDST